MDILARLYPATINGIIFPTSIIEEAGSMMTVEHTPLQGSGGFIETMGRASDRWTLSIPLYAGMLSGPNEDDFSDLFPIRHTDLLNELRQPLPVDFLHPSRGWVKAKMTDYSYGLDATRRNGVELRLSLAEHVETQADKPLETNPDFADIVVGELKQTVYDLTLPDDLLGEIGGLISDIEGAAKEIQAAIEAPGLLADQIGGKIDRLGSACDRIGGSLERATGPVGEALDWLTKTREVAERAQKKKEQDRPTKSFIVPGEVALPMVAQTLGNSVEDIVYLNPHLAKSIVVKEGALVRYYAA